MVRLACGSLRRAGLRSVGRFQLESQVGDIVQPLAQIAHQTPFETAADSRRAVGWQDREVDLVPKYRCQGVWSVLTQEGATARERLVETRSKRPDIGALVDWPARSFSRPSFVSRAR